MAGISIVTCGKMRWNRSSALRLKVASNFFTLSILREAVHSGLAMPEAFDGQFRIGAEQVDRLLSCNLHRPPGCPPKFRARSASAKS